MSKKLHHGYAVALTYDPHWPYDGDPVGVWCAHPIAMPGCITQGHTKSEALADLDRIIPIMHEHAAKHGRTLPQPDVPECVGGLEFIGEWDSGMHLEWISVGPARPQDAEDRATPQTRTRDE